MKGRIALKNCIEPGAPERFQEEIDDLLLGDVVALQLVPERLQAKMREAFREVTPIDPVGKFADALTPFRQEIEHRLRRVFAQRFAVERGAGRLEANFEMVQFLFVRRERMAQFARSRWCASG